MTETSGVPFPTPIAPLSSRHAHYWMLVKKTEHNYQGELLVTQYKYKCACGSILEQNDG